MIWPTLHVLEIARSNIEKTIFLEWWWLFNIDVFFCKVKLTTCLATGKVLVFPSASGKSLTIEDRTESRLFNSLNFILSKGKIHSVELKYQRCLNQDWLLISQASGCAYMTDLHGLDIFQKICVIYKKQKSTHNLKLS